MNRPWSSHYATLLKKNLQPAATLVKALSFFQNESLLSQDKKAIDVGCGTGIDTFALLEDGWFVTAIDKEKDAIEQVDQKLAAEHKSYFNGLVSTFETMQISPVLLINASFALPFTYPNQFDAVWNKINNAVKKGGRFAGQFFGLHDSWINRTEMTFHSNEQIEQLFADFSIEFFHEVDEDSQTLNGKQKHWHVYHIVARKL
ncbi:MAG TPA: class I SAM-dependent methyltransferase [Niastella sp.]